MKQRKSMTRKEREREEMRRWLCALALTAAVVVAVPVAFLNAFAACAW